MGVEKVFQFVDDDQEKQRGAGCFQRVRQADDDDDDVRQQVAEHRDQAGDEGDGDQRLGQRQVDAEQRQQ